MANNFFEGRIEIEIDKAALTDLFQKKAEKAFQKVANDLEGRFTAAIDGAHWGWTGQSKRGLSGSTVGERAKSWKDSSFDIHNLRLHLVRRSCVEGVLVKQGGVCY